MTDTFDNDIPHILHSYNILSVLGEGDCSIVLLAEKDGNHFAIKKVYYFGQYENELIVNKAISEHSEENKYFPKYYDSFVIDECGYIVFEYIEGVTLCVFCREKKAFDDNIVKKFALHLLKSFRYLYTKIGYIHNDIHTDNIMIAHDKLFIIDFGLATNIKQLNGHHPCHDLIRFVDILSVLKCNDTIIRLLDRICQEDISYIQKINDMIALFE